MELHSGLVSVVGVDVDVVDPLRIEVRGPPDQPVNLVPFVEQEFRQVGPVLTGYAGDQRNLAVLLRWRSRFSVGNGSGSGGFVLGRHCCRARGICKTNRVEMEGERAVN